MGMTIEELEPLEDPRHGNAERHSLHDILVIALCTILCGGETCTDMALFGHSKRQFLESFLPLRHGIPSHDTFSRLQACPPARFNQIARAHWGIENQLHWVLEVVFNEDQSRNRKDNCPDHLALLRKLALNPARLEPSK